MTYKDIEGLGEFGSTKQTIEIAEKLYRNEAARHDLIKTLRNWDSWITYSGQDGDRRAHVAQVLADLIRA